ncbi:hypothetical protein [Nocardia sp. NBC_00416]|uniref:hypothetical protein n=1 Tax=Nocardia sp. NBC_00416 TaxID=2975991 RepID=UPI002E1F3079
MEYNVRFPEGYSEREEWEASVKGWVQVVVTLSDGRGFQLSFYDPVRLSQTLDDEMAAGRPYVTEPNLVVLEEVSTANIHSAIADMVEQQFFESALPGCSFS